MISTIDQNPSNGLLRLGRLIITLLFIPGSLLAQVDTEFLFPIEIKEDTYQGAGIEWIMRRSDSIQFVLFGEQHNVQGIAEFVDFMYHQLHPEGFKYLVLETDGWTTQRAADLGVITFTQKNPHSIAFDTNGDLKLMQSAIDLNPDIATPIWGVDQMQTAIHPYARLIEIANTHLQRIAARGAHLKATLKMGRYTRQDHRKDLDALELIFQSNTSPEKDQIIRELRQTIDIFYRWMDPATRNASVQSRETLMGTNFETYLKTAPEAKAVFKMGGAHTMNGIGPNGILTFGDHVAKLAAQKNQQTLSISIQRYRPENSLIDSTAFGESPLLLVDSKAAQALYPEVEKLHKVDAIILLKGAGYADKGINRVYEADFRNRFIRSIIPLGLCLLILLIVLITYLIQVARKKPGTLKWPAIASAATIGLLVYQLLPIVLNSSPATISTSFFPTLVHLTFALAALLFCYQSFVRFRRKAAGRVVYSIFTITFAITSVLIHYWNLGGMLA